MVQSKFECARWTFWRSLDAGIVAILPLTAVVIEANAQYAVKPIWAPNGRAQSGPKDVLIFPDGSS